MAILAEINTFQKAHIQNESEQDITSQESFQMIKDNERVTVADKDARTHIY